MKKHIAMFFALSALLTACKMGTTNGIATSVKSIQESEAAYDIDMQLPQIQGLSDADTEKDINDRLVQFGSDQKAQFLKDIKDIYIAPEDDVKSGLMIRFKAVTLSNTLISIVLDVAPYMAGAAHPNLITFPFSYDVDAMKPITFADLFNPKTPYLERLSELSIAQLIETSKKNGTYFEAKEQSVKAGAAPKAENFRTFAILNDTLILTFDPYQVGPYAEGVQTVVLMRKDITDVLSNEGRKLLSETEMQVK